MAQETARMTARGDGLSETPVREANRHICAAEPFSLFVGDVCGPPCLAMEAKKSATRPPSMAGGARLFHGTHLYLSTGSAMGGGGGRESARFRRPHPTTSPPRHPLFLPPFFFFSSTVRVGRPTNGVGNAHKRVRISLPPIFSIEV